MQPGYLWCILKFYLTFEYSILVAVSTNLLQKWELRFITECELKSVWCSGNKSWFRVGKPDLYHFVNWAKEFYPSETL